MWYLQSILEGWDTKTCSLHTSLHICPSYRLSTTECSTMKVNRVLLYFGDLLFSQMQVARLKSTQQILYVPIQRQRLQYSTAHCLMIVWQWPRLATFFLYTAKSFQFWSRSNLKPYFGYQTLIFRRHSLLYTMTNMIFENSVVGKFKKESDVQRARQWSEADQREDRMEG